MATAGWLLMMLLYVSWLLQQSGSGGDIYGLVHSWEGALWARVPALHCYCRCCCDSMLLLSLHTAAVQTKQSRKLLRFTGCIERAHASICKLQALVPGHRCPTAVTFHVDSSDVAAHYTYRIRHIALATKLESFLLALGVTLQCD